MRICPECGSTKVQEDGEIVCTGCGLVLKDRDIMTQRIQDNFNFADRSWEDSNSFAVTHYKIWVQDQRKLAKQLGLEKVGVYLRHFCSICGKPAKKRAKLDLCPEHAEEWQKARDRRKHKALYHRNKG